MGGWYVFLLTPRIEINFACEIRLWHTADIVGDKSIVFEVVYFPEFFDIAKGLLRNCAWNHPRKNSFRPLSSINNSPPFAFIVGYVWLSIYGDPTLIDGFPINVWLPNGRPILPLSPCETSWCASATCGTQASWQNSAGFHHGNTEGVHSDLGMK